MTGVVLENKEAKITSALSALRERYRERLPMELEELRRLAEHLDSRDLDQVQHLHQRLHKLAGSGGTFGLAELSQRARTLEQAAKELLERTGEDSLTNKINMLSDGICALSAALMAAKPEEDDSSSIAPNTSAQLSEIWLLELDTALALELKSQLDQFGYRIRVFHEFTEAQKAAANVPPDFVLLGDRFLDDDADTTSPPDANTVKQAFRCPFAIVSGQDGFSQRVRAARLGAVEFLLKPLELPRLVTMLDRVQQSRQACSCRVLIVDDDENLSEHFRLTLKRAGMEVSVLSQPQEIMQCLSEFRPELILLDLNMPEFSGPELAAIIRQHEEWVSLPIVYLSAETDLDKQLQALGHGADDFLTKPISDAHLIKAVQVRAARSKQLADLVAKDSLTGLLKHARIKEELNIELDRAVREGRPLSVAMLDIDHFKLVNDTYGHAMGDRVIQAIAHVLRQRLRKSDKIGRYGGEEFAIALPGCDSDLAYTILEDIRERFAALHFTHLGKKFQCTLSAGIACNQHHPGADSNQLLNLADQALYKAKRANRNQVQIAQSGKN